MPKRCEIAFLFLIVFTAIFPACSIVPLATHRIRIEAPLRPPCWEELPWPLKYDVSWIDVTGTKITALLIEGEAIEISMQRGMAQAILAAPRNPFGSPETGFPTLSPAGALYPENLGAGPRTALRQRADPLPLSWSQGYAAATALAVERLGGDPWGYPLSALQAKWAVSACDPWLVDPGLVAEKLLEGSFRPTIFSKPLMEVELECSGHVYPESALALVRSTGNSIIMSLGQGTSRLFAKDGLYWLKLEGEECSIIFDEISAFE